MINYKLSIIIPIYKVEDYIEECLNSILKQLTSKIEVICINDGTPDQSMEIARFIISKCNKNIQSQFVFIDQENQGLSSARNTGIDIARGEYISFLDSDDMISPVYISTLLSVVGENEYDIIDFNLVTSLEEIISIHSDSSNSLNSIFSKGMWFASARVINRKFLGNDRFTPNIYYEDLCLIPKLYIKCKKIKYINESLYWYRVNPSGITLSNNSNVNIKTIKSFEKILETYLDEYRLCNDNSKRFLAVIVCQAYFLLCVNVCRRFSLKKANYYLNLYKIVNDIFYLERKNIDFNRKIYIFLNSSRLYLLLYRFYCQIKYR